MVYKINIICMISFISNKVRTERRNRCDVTDQQASRDSREAADSCYARLRHQFRTDASQHEPIREKCLDYLSCLHQQRCQLLHLPGGEQGIQEGDKGYIMNVILKQVRPGKEQSVFVLR